MNLYDDLPEPIELPPGGVAQVVLLKPTFDQLQTDVRSHGCFLVRVPGDNDSELPTYFIAVGEKRREEVQ